MGNYNATFTSVWDDGSIKVNARCHVKLRTMEIDKIGKNDISPEIEENLEILEEEYVTMDNGKVFPAYIDERVESIISDHMEDYKNNYPSDKIDDDWYIDSEKEEERYRKTFLVYR